MLTKIVQPNQDPMVIAQPVLASHAKNELIATPPAAIIIGLAQRLGGISFLRYNRQTLVTSASSSPQNPEIAIHTNPDPVPAAMAIPTRARDLLEFENIIFFVSPIATAASVGATRMTLSAHITVSHPTTVLAAAYLEP